MTRFDDNKTICSLNRSPEGSTLYPAMWRVMAGTNYLRDLVT